MAQRFYLDASALAKRYVVEQGTLVVNHLFRRHVPGLAFFDMEAELSRLIGRQVDLNTPQFLSRYFRDIVLAEAEVLYDAA